MDDLLLSKIRLAIIATLLHAEWVSFSALVKAAETTNGNLGAHVGKLVEAGYVNEEKSFVARKPQSRYNLTIRGREAFAAHVREMQALLSGGQS